MDDYFLALTRLIEAIGESKNKESEEETIIKISQRIHWDISAYNKLKRVIKKQG